MKITFEMEWRLFFTEINDMANIPTRKIARSIASNQSLKSVFVNAELNIENKHLIYEALYENEGIRDVEFLNKVNPAAVGLCLNRLNNLNAVRFYRSEITVEGIHSVGRMLSGCPSLESLHVFSCRVDDDKAVALCESLLRQCQSLDSLRLGLDKVGNRGAAAVAAYVSENQVLKSLDISYTKNVVDDGFVALGKALKQNVSLEELELIWAYTATDRGTRAILDGVSAHPALKRVRIDHLSNTSQRDELDFYLHRNNHAKPLLHANLPLGIWPRVLKRADDCRHTVGKRLRAPDLLHYFVKEKCELFSRGSSSRKRKRGDA